MPTKNFPFAITPKTKIINVGDAESGIFYMIKKGSTTPRENPVNQQELEISAAKTQIKIMRAIAKLADAENISKAAARQKLFNTKLKTADDGDEVVAEVDDKDSDDALSMYDYLEEGDALELITLSTKNNDFDVKINAVTLFIKYRILFPVKIAENNDPGATELKIEELSQNLEIGTRIKFGKIFVITTEYAEAGADKIIIQNAPGKLFTEQVGFICEKDSRKLLIGIDKYEDELEVIDSQRWNPESTKENLTLEQIDLIFKFYQEEAGVNIAEITNSEVGTKDEGESSRILSDSSQEAQSNGQKSGSGLTTSAVDSTNSKDGKALVASQS